MRTAEDYNRQGVERKQRGDLAGAQEAYERAIQLKPQLVEAHHNLGILWRDQGRFDQALPCFERAIALRPDLIPPRFELANLLSAIQDWDAAREMYDAILKLDSRFVAAQFNRGNTLLEQRRWPEAEDSFRAVLRATPNDASAWTNLGTALREQRRLEEAGAAYREAVQRDPQLAPAWTNLGTILRDLGDSQEAVACHERAIMAQPQLAEAYLNLGNAHHDADRYGEAIHAYQRAFQLFPDQDDAWLNTGHLLREMGDVDQARKVYAAHAARRPGDPLYRLRQVATCPVVFDSADQLASYRRDFLAVCEESAESALPWDLARFPLFAPECPFPLQFLDGNLRPLKAAFARVYRRYFAKWSEPIAARPQRARPRVGIVVVSHRANSFVRPFGGVVRGLDRTRFEVVVLCPQGIAAAVRAGLACDDVPVIGFASRLGDAAETLRATQCDLLYHWEVGNNAANYFLPFFRLAPVQVTSWGIQVTSGIPTLDAYLSSEWIEPADAATHYSERLVLGKTLLAYREPVLLPSRIRERGEFGLRADQRLYGCLQNLGKFHPDFDETLAGILRADERGVIVIARDQPGLAARQLSARFARTMPDVADRVIFTAPLPQDDYLSVLKACDVLLDPPHFGGVTTTYDALSLGVPLVTRPSGFERGMYTSGLLRRLGLVDAIASDSAQYVRLATEIAQDSERRADWSRRVAEVRDEAFRTTAAVREHDELFQQLLDETGP